MKHRSRMQPIRFDDNLYNLFYCRKVVMALSCFALFTALIIVMGMMDINIHKPLGMITSIIMSLGWVLSAVSAIHLSGIAQFYYEKLQENHRKND